MNTDLSKFFEIRDGQGQILCSVWACPELLKQLGKETGRQGKEPDNDQNAGAWPREEANPPKDPMSNAQKRYLFRLLAEKGIEGDAAYERLKETFGVDSLAEVSKKDASQAIEGLLQNNGR
mgnify:CR=1 FL=1